MVAPNPIDMGAVFAGLKNLGDNLGVLMVIITIFLLYTLLCVWARKKDRIDEIDVRNFIKEIDLKISAFVSQIYVKLALLGLKKSVNYIKSYTTIFPNKLDIDTI